jgi:hypothetical protein
VAALIALAGVAALLAGCSGDSSAPRFNADPVQYLLKLAQMESPDFTVEIPATSQPAAGFASGDPTVQSQLNQAGLTGAASVTFSRVVDFPTSNGPIEVVDSLARFTGEDGAHQWFTTDGQRLNKEQGAVPVSTGALGDEVHATTQVATAPDGVQAVQITLEWRVSNVVVLLHVRGRYGGTRLDDALTLAHRQTSTQLR